ncbi:exodeoxyribonuclease V subunit gamma [Pistricoccus aurantiacus]|uniref:exodeoxyribonuclease V subunit gamma n=1 Tax=Pistricoccus aurantiacus TaxID=1883414 RepID=UPI0036305148
MPLSDPFTGDLFEHLAPDDSLTPGFMVIHGNRLEDLRNLAVTWMRCHPLAPLENETILVQSNGISQWLKLALAQDEAQGGCGIAASLELVLPARFLWQAYRALLGEETVPATSPFDKSRLVWRLMRLLPAWLKEPDFAPLARFLDGDADLRKRHQLAERLADLFDQYQVYRADWLDAWANGQDVLIDARGQAKALAPEQRWQARLWRALIEDVSENEAGTSRAAVHRRFLAAAESRKDRPPELPRRVLVFGISSLPSQTLEALAAMARFSQVVLCVHNPCQHYWADIIEHRDLLRAERYRQRLKPGMPRDIDETELHLHAQPLLAAWGKQGRDYLRLLDEFDEHSRYRQLFEREALRIDLFEPYLQDDAGCLLQQLQEDIRELRPLGETRERWPAVDVNRDHSMAFHIAHSPLREVEILHDQLLAAFSADSSLRPRDIIVMVPDIAAYAAPVQAVFGRLERDDPRYIPFTLSDQASRHRHALLIALEKLLHLPELRLSVSDLLDLLEAPALRARFRIAESQLPVLTRWIEEAGVRWGLDALQREHLELPAGLDHNTWRFGLRRLLLGYAVGANESPWRDIEPFDDIGGLEAALVGPLMALLDALDIHWQALKEPAPVDAWCQRLRELLDSFFLAEEEADLLMLARLEQALETWQEGAEEARLKEELPLCVVREHWLSQIDDGGLTQRFQAGAVNVATLMPMRAIPFRQVYLLGMNDEDYPRRHPPLDFDLMGQDYRPGDRSRREDDRYLFLEALLSARERFSVSWVGRSIVDNSEKPPSVLLGQLRDHLAQGWRLVGSEHESGKALVEALTTAHPLQPFSRAYFTSDSGSDSRLFTYAREWQTVHQAAAEPASDLPLDAFTPEAPLTLGQLGAFLTSPIQAFYTQRLGVFMGLPETGRQDQEPFDLNGLEHWQLSQTLIEAQRFAVDSGDCRETALFDTLERLQRQGRLAVGGFGERMRETLIEPMENLFDEYAKVLDAWPYPVEEPQGFSLPLGDDLLLEDWLEDLRCNPAGDYCRVLLLSSSLIRKSKYHWKHWLRPWVVHLVGQIALGPMTTRLISKAGHGTFEPLEAEAAQAQLDTLVDAWRQGMCQPLPLPRDTAFAWLEAGGDEACMRRCLAGELDDNKPWWACRREFEGSGFSQGEIDREAGLARQWPSFEALMHNQGEAFSEWCERLYAPLYRTVKAPGKKP